ncbi:MAG TPA: hypothetical protein VFW44_05980 [Bryobacteraceae bacterium]|nr:hypothetical protein [Bryobacteraceae bacterium]
MKWLCFFAVLPLAAQVPDISGVWLPQHISNLAPAASVSLLPAAKAQFQANSGKRPETDARCLPPGVPRIMLQSRPFEIVQDSNRILFLFEGGGHVWRQIWMDDRAQPKDPNPDWLGHSIGHWEAATLVVDTVGFNNQTWLDDSGLPHSEQLHVIEKFTRTAPGKMKYSVRIDDPGAYSKPWESSSILTFQPAARLAEDICLDKPPAR